MQKHIGNDGDNNEEKHQRNKRATPASTLPRPGLRTTKHLLLMRLVCHSMCIPMRILRDSMCSSMCILCSLVSRIRKSHAFSPFYVMLETSPLDMGPEPEVHCS